jgi:uroporphyrinogen decarboxylase
LATMNSRERVVAALNHQEPDRVPISLGGTAHKITDELFVALCQHFGLDCTPSRVLTGLSFTYYDDQILEALGTDTRFLHLGAPEPYKQKVYPDGRYENEWGIVFKDEGHYQGVVGNPLRNATQADLKIYPWPKVQDPIRVTGLPERARSLYELGDSAIIAYRATMAGLFETASMLRGMEQFMVDLLLDKPFAQAMLDKILELHFEFYRLQLDAVGPYVHVVEVLDDYGTQSGLMISPALYREMLLPRHRQLVALIHKLAPQAKIMFHSCGGVAPLIPDFIEAGFDILNPLQPRAAGMDLFKIKAEYGKYMSFLGGLDVQQTLRGPRSGVEQETAELIRTLAPGGGFIFAPSHNLSQDVPVENVLHMLATVQDYGRYPVSG